MKKFLRITADVVAAVVLFVMIVPLVLSLVLQIGFVQNAIVHKLSEIATRVVDTPVTIEKVAIRFPSRAVIEGFTVLDPVEHDTLLGVRRMEAEVNVRKMIGGEVAFRRAAIDGGALYLNNDSTGTLNLKLVINKFVDRDKPRNPKPFRMSIDRIEVDSFHFEFRKYDAPGVEYGVNFKDMRFCDIATRINGFRLIRDTISMNIEGIAFTERCGLKLNTISADSLYMCPSVIRLSDAMFDLEGRTTGHIRRYAMYFDRWTMSDYLNTVKMEADIERSRIDFATITQFTGRMLPMKAVVEFSGTASGTVADMRGRIERLATRGAVIRGADFRMQGLPDVRTTRFSLDLPDLKASSGDIYDIYEDFTGKRMAYSPIVSRIGDIGLNGYFRGSLADFESRGEVTTSVGPLSFDVTNRPAARGSRLKGHVEVKGVDMGRLLAVAGMKGLTMNMDVETRTASDSLVLETKGEIESFVFKGYDYRGIKVDGKLGNSSFRGYVGSDDPNLDFDFDGLIELSGRLPRFNFRLGVHRADLALLGFDKRRDVSRLSGVVEAVGYGSDIDDLNGTITVDSLLYYGGADTIKAGHIAMMTRNDDDSKYLRLNSDFADLELQGRRSYRNIFEYFKNTVRKYLPALQNSDIRSVTETLTTGEHSYDVPAAPPEEVPDTLAPTDAEAMNDYYIARLNVKSATGVADIFVPGLNVAEGTSMSFLFNPTLNRFSLSLKSDYIMKGENIVSNLNIDSRSDADSISLFIRAGDVVAGNLYFPDVSVFGGIRNNSVGLYGRFENRGDGSAAFIASRSRFAVDPNTGLTRLYVGMLPGYIRLSGQTWNIRSSVTALDSTGIEVDNFVITDGVQSITVDGKASRNVADTLSVRVSGFDLSPLSAFVDTMGYTLGGAINGDIRLVSLLKDPFFLSDIDIRRLTVNGHVYPDVSIRSLYDERNRDILYDMTAGDSLRLVTGMFHLPDGDYRAEIDLPGIDLSVISPMLRGISSGVSGEADVSLVLTRKNDFPCLNGAVDIRGFSTTIDFTKVRYSVSGKAIVKDNMVSMTGATLTDELGTVAPFEASATHTRFKRVNYKIRTLPKNMLCMNTTSRDNGIFFGRVFASGDMSVTGRGKAVTMVVNAATEDQSTFNMPLSDKSTMKEADFITFVKPVVEESLTRRLIRERDKKMSSTGVFDIRLNLDIRPNTYAQIVIDPTIGDIIKVRGNGQLIVDARPSTGEFSINGGYEIEEGGYLFTLQNLINKYFTIEQGSNIKWSGDPLGADLNITATYKVKASLAPLLGGSGTNFNRRADVDCNIKLTGQLMHPDVQLGITVPNADPETQSMISSALNTEEAVSLQLFWLLLANTFYADSSTQNEGTVNVGLANSVAVTGLEFLSNQIGNWLSGDKFNLGFSYRPKDATNSDELELSISAPLLKDKLYLDAEGNVNFKNNTAYLNDDAGNLSGDASLTWILDNSGNIRMKAFTRQINTFDENQGLQESGVGIYYKEDFNRFGDVVRKFRTQLAELERKRTEKRAAMDSLGVKVYRDSVRTIRRADREAARKQDEAVRKISRDYVPQ